MSGDALEPLPMFACVCVCVCLRVALGEGGPEDQRQQVATTQIS